MKKRAFLIATICIFAIQLQAQFLMQSSSHILRDGDEHYFNIANNVEPGVPGANVIWDFSNLTKQSELTSYMYNAYTTAKTKAIPEANTVLEEYGTKFYFNSNGNIIELYGTVTANNTITKYDKPFTKMVFPFNYGDTYSGDFSGTIEGANNYKATFNGTYVLEADAYGTLKLPNGVSYKNVLRIKTTREQCYNNSNSCNCGNISYKWYIKNLRYPVLTIIQSKSNTGTRTIRTAYYAKAKNEAKKTYQENSLAANIQLKAYPNPFNSEFKLDYNLNANSDVTIEIFNEVGARVYLNKKYKQEAGYYTKTISSEELGEQLGLFHIRIIAGGETFSETVVRGE